MKRRAVPVSIVLGLTIFLAVAAWSEDGLDPDDDPQGEAAREAILRNDRIEKLPYVTDVQPGREVCGKGSNAVTSAHYTVIVVETDNEDHVTLLERKVPGSLEGFPVIVGVDHYPQWELEGKQMMAKVQPVIDDPANKWILKIPHVVRMLPATTNTDEGEPTSPAVGIAVDSGK